MAKHNVIMFGYFSDSTWAGASGPFPTPIEAAATLVKVQSALDGSGGPAVNADRLRLKSSGLDAAGKILMPTLILYDATSGGTLIDDLLGGADDLKHVIDKDVLNCSYDGLMYGDVIADD